MSLGLAGRRARVRQSRRVNTPWVTETQAHQLPGSTA